MTATIEYPVEVFVDVQAQMQKIDRPGYQLLRREQASSCHDWQCSHFVTVGRSMLRYDPNLDDSGKAVTLCCETDPMQIVGVNPFERMVFCKQDQMTRITMRYRVEVSGYQIKRKAPNPIRLFQLDNPRRSFGDLSFNWVSQIEFEGTVYGQREDDRIWLETAGAIKWT
jgi:hypothetical protein